MFEPKLALRRSSFFKDYPKQKLIKAVFEQTFFAKCLLLTHTTKISYLVLFYDDPLENAFIDFTPTQWMLIISS